jgi:prevent-host-death family protein
MKKSRIPGEMHDARSGRKRTDVAASPNRRIGIRAASAQFSRLVTRAERGQRVLITRAGEPVAILQATSRIKRSRCRN